MISYTLVGEGEQQSLSFVNLVTGESGNYERFGELDPDSQQRILDIINNSDPTVQDIYQEIGHVLHSRSDYIRQQLNIRITSEHVVVDGVQLPKRIQKLLEGAQTLEDAQTVVKFAHKLAANPAQHSQEALIEWLLHNPSLSFTQDGDIVGYRAVSSNFLSNHSGYGIVNGVEYEKANLDNSPGNVLEFPRSMIDADTSQYCSIGLHVGTWDYAQNYSRSFLGGFRRIAVAFSPEDVVSPPDDAYQEKIRVAKYRVVAEITKPYQDFIVNTLSEN